MRHAAGGKVGRVLAMVVGHGENWLVLAVLGASWVDDICDAICENDTEDNMRLAANLFSPKVEARLQLRVEKNGREFLDVPRVV